MNHIPAISVLMPAHNAAAFIDVAIQSVLSQSFGDFELLIVDDGSTDDTADRIFLYDDPRIRLIQTSHQGIAPALNAGLLAIKSSLVARFDADDICHSERLGHQVRFMQEHPQHVICGTEADYLDEEGNFVFHYAPPAHSDEAIRSILPRFCPFIHSSVVYRKEAVLACGGYNEHAKTFEDHFLWTALLRMGKAANLNESLLQVRLNPSSITIDERWRPRRFHRIRDAAIRQGKISVELGRELQQILSIQKKGKCDMGAYHSLLAKKFLWDNYHPDRARIHLRHASALRPYDVRNYLLGFLSYLPQDLIRGIYRLSAHASHNSA